MRRAELRTLQIGAIAIVVAASTFNAFELDRFFVPKDLVLHLVALVAGALAMRHLSIARSDRFLVWYLGLSAISALFATNHWLAFRALAISVSAAVVFWVARTVTAVIPSVARDPGDGRLDGPSLPPPGSLATLGMTNGLANGL